MSALLYRFQEMIIQLVAWEGGGDEKVKKVGGAECAMSPPPPILRLWANKY